MGDDGVTPIEKFLGTKKYITPKNHHTWGCPAYVLDEILQGNIADFPKWKPHSHTGIYLFRSPFHAGSVALVLNPATGNVLPQLHMVFNY